MIPAPILFRWWRLKWRLFGGEAAFRGMSNQEVFEKIYAEDIWGRHDDGTPHSGPGSHEPELVDPYLAAVTALFDRLGPIGTIVDIGCGDFSVGHRLAPFAERYVACDVAETVIRSNRAKWSLPNVEFRQLDIATDDLPPGDVAIVRQVLQHVSNADIASFIGKLHAHAPYKHLIVTEHLYRGSGFAPNRDKHRGRELRVQSKSGVVLHEPPFDLQHLSRDVLCETTAPIWHLDAFIRTTHYRLAE